MYRLKPILRKKNATIVRLSITIVALRNTKVLLNATAVILNPTIVLLWKFPSSRASNTGEKLKIL